MASRICCLQNIIRMMKWAEHVTCIGETINIYMIDCGKSAGKDTFWKTWAYIGR